MAQRSENRSSQFRNRFVYIERHGGELELAGFDLREIQNVVDDAEERLAGPRHVLHEPLLAVIQRR